MAGPAEIAGLPFRASTYNISVGSIGYGALVTLPAGFTQISTLIATDENVAILTVIGSAQPATNLDATNINNGTQIYGSISYHI